jgi:hypothetical protein
MERPHDIIHRGARPGPWYISTNGKERDWPQILDDIVTEILRYKLRARPTTGVGEHVRRWREAGPTVVA